MTTSMFDYAASGGFQNPRVYALNKAQMYQGAPTVQVVSFDAPASDFTILPANARIQTGTPPAGSPKLLFVDVAIPKLPLLFTSFTLIGIGYRFRHLLGPSFKPHRRVGPTPQSRTPLP